MAKRAEEQTSAKVVPVVNVTEMDHIALRVRDVDTSLRFYSEILGLKTERLEELRAGKVPFPSVRLTEDTVIDVFKFEDMPPLGDTPRNQDHYCIVVEPTDLAQVALRLQELGVKLAPASPFDPTEIGGPFKRWGAHGTGTSLYVYDPDENIVELRHY